MYLFPALIHELIVLFDLHGFFGLSSLDNFLGCLFAFSTMLQNRAQMSMVSISNAYAILTTSLILIHVER